MSTVLSHLKSAGRSLNSVYQYTLSQFELSVCHFELPSIVEAEEGERRGRESYSILIPNAVSYSILALQKRGIFEWDLRKERGKRRDHNIR